MGACFTVNNPNALNTLHVGQCVEVTYTSPHDSIEPLVLKTAKPAEAKKNRNDCPMP